MDGASTTAEDAMNSAATPPSANARQSASSSSVPPADRPPLDEAAIARWRVLHTDYLMAHEQYMLAKLAREAAAGQIPDPAGALMARARLLKVQEALSEFCRDHAIM